MELKENVSRLIQQSGEHGITRSNLYGRIRYALRGGAIELDEIIEELRIKGEIYIATNFHGATCYAKSPPSEVFLSITRPTIKKKEEGVISVICPICAGSGFIIKEKKILCE